jgi:hypothetical protein
MAVCWESARDSERGLPPEVAATIDSFPALRGAQLLIGIPEHKVSFEGGGHASQNDLWALLKTTSGFVSLAVEAKAGEKLDDLVREWLPKDGVRSRKAERLAALQRRLAIAEADTSAIRYQLLHRTASALKEAERFGASWAVLLVQSFNRQADQESFQDYLRFAELMLAPAAEGQLVASGRKTPVPLLLGWVWSQPADLDRLAAAV